MASDPVLSAITSSDTDPVMRFNCGALTVRISLFRRSFTSAPVTVRHSSKKGKNYRANYSDVGFF